MNVEAYQFSVINSEAKKVDKYLATAGILKGGGPIPTSQNAWEGRAHVVCERLRLDPTSPLKIDFKPEELNQIYRHGESLQLKNCAA